MPEEQLPEIPEELLKRLNVSKDDAHVLGRFFAASVREQMQNEFYRDVGKGAFGLLKKALIVGALYLAWRGAGGSAGWLESFRKFFIG